MRINIIIFIMSASKVDKEARGKTEPIRRSLQWWGRPRITSHELLGEFEEFIIEHAGEEYRLRRTRLNKLILTK
jgi:hemin uptake protein HemP